MKNGLRLTLIWSEFLILVKNMSEHQDYINSTLDRYEKKCQKGGVAGMGYKTLVKRKRNAQKSKGVAGWGYKILFDKKKK